MPMATLELKTPSELLDDIVRLRKSLEQIAAVCADNASPRCNKGMALKFIADVVRVTLTNGHRGSEG
ncbi:hypothetical protein KUL72_20680 [Bradyrhizobium arachidis]|uniref:hypothetical protein n=1 Tax=Bradyrhizobium arachidis TaxID=858423 RepID=UPI002162C29A|nr:hypothetical protein [Bradyrhizobium arachidis]UVO33932.1 hypothetical protein KUL72_20680 [Bradyrhizobium arachidis]